MNALISDIKQKAIYTRPSRLKTWSKILLQKDSRDGVQRHYVGDVLQIRRPNRTTVIVMLKVLEYWEGGRQSFKIAKKPLEILCNKNIDIWLISDASVDEAQKKIADARKAYAQARNMLKNQRVFEDVHFTMLGITSNISMEDFVKTRKKVMLKWHPDRFFSSGLSKESFEESSKKYLEALSFVEQYLTRKFNRIKLN